MEDLPLLQLTHAIDDGPELATATVAAYRDLIQRLRGGASAATTSHALPTAPSSSSAPTEALDGTLSKPTDAPHLRLPPTVDDVNRRYLRKRKIGEGGFGDVYLALDVDTQAYVAIKISRLLLHRSGRSNVGLHSTVARELQALTELRHPNIVPLLRYEVLENGVVMLVFPVIAHDLGAVLRVSRGEEKKSVPPYSRASQVGATLPLRAVKCIFQQLVDGIAYLHACNYIHRDLKIGNVMVHSDGTVVVVDFGWSRFLSTSSDDVPKGPAGGYRLTGPVCIEQTRPPEVLMGGGAGGYTYDFSVDMWCVGVILFHLLRGVPPFPKARSDLEAITEISDLLGSPSPSSPRYYGTGKATKTFPRGRTSQLAGLAATWGWDAPTTDLVERLLRLEPSERLTAEQARNHPWLTTTPLPCEKSDIPLPTSNSYRHIYRQLRK